MADISTELARILAATYGNEVRGSIHDAIEKINDVSEVVMTAGTDVTSSSSSTSGYYSGSIYYNTNTYELWRCIGSSWELLGSLKGSTGAQGIQGLQGIGIQSVTDNHDGTFSFTLTNGTSTGNIATIKGEKGDTGAAGAAGAKGRDVTNIQMTGTGKVHPISVTYSDGITQNIGTLQDGADGSGSGDMQFATYDPTQSGIVESARALSDGSTTLPLSTVLNKADKADSISGYGITDAYTKSEVDDSIEDAIEGLSASSVGGTGKIITQISETDGVISATAASLTDIVDGSTVKVVNNKLTASSSSAQINSIEKSIAPIWQSGSYSSGYYVMDVDKLYKNNSANATTGIPGVSSDWVETSVGDEINSVNSEIDNYNNRMKFIEIPSGKALRITKTNASMGYRLKIDMLSNNAKVMLSAFVYSANNGANINAIPIFEPEQKSYNISTATNILTLTPSGNTASACVVITEMQGKMNGYTFSIINDSTDSIG